MSGETTAKVEHQLRELRSSNPRSRANMLRALTEHPPTDPAVISACEGLLEDRAITLLSIPYRFGEIRAVAAEVVWAIRNNLGIDDAVVVPDALPICSTNHVGALAARGDRDGTRRDRRRARDAREARRREPSTAQRPPPRDRPLEALARLTAAS